MAEKDGEPADDLELDPPVEQGDADVEKQDLEAEEQETEPEQDEVDASGEQDRSQDARQQQQPSRRDRRIETLTTALADERRQREDTNRRLDALLAGQTNRPQGETPEARANCLALLSPEERIREELQVATQSFAREQQNLRFQVMDGNDRAAFEAKATVDPLYTKWKPKVETELASLRQQGMNVDREKLMYYLIGKNAVESRNATKGQQRAEGARNVRRQQARPSNSGSDVQANRRDRTTSLERRLENQSL